MAFAVVEKNICAVAHGVDDQIEIAVAIDIGKGSAGASASTISDAGFLGDVLEFPIPEIAIENVVAVDAAKIKVTPAVAVHIARGDAGTIQEDLVGDVAFKRQH